MDNDLTLKMQIVAGRDDQTLNVEEPAVLPGLFGGQALKYHGLAD
jgi:hypothetical protein